MSYEDSPSLDLYSDGLPSEMPDPQKEKRQIRLIVLFLTFIALLLLVINFLQTDYARRLSGIGSVSGLVTDGSNQPLEAEIYVIGTDFETKTSSTGRFVLDGIPAGKQSIAVVHRGAGLEYPVLIEAGENVDLGQIRLVSTQVPPVQSDP